jgi:VanZ family protein
MKWLTVIFILFIIAIVIMADAGRLPAAFTALYEFRNGDKVAHFLLMGLLNFLVVMSYTLRRGTNLSRTSLICSLVVAVLVAIEEGSQLFFPSRKASWGDLLSSYAGIISFGCLAFWIRNRKNQRAISE